MRRIGVAAVGAGVVVCVVVGGALLVQSRLDMPALRRAVIASVERQSGRSMQLGSLQVRLLPTPRIEADDVALGDRPGAAAPPMLAIGHLRAGIALWPLLRHVVRLDRLQLDDVTVHAIRDADGHGNWQMTPRPRAPGEVGRPSGPAVRWGVEFGSVQVRRARISWRDAMLRHGADLDLTMLAASGLQGERPQFRIAGMRGDAGYGAWGTTGPVRRLFDGDDRQTAWPVSVQATQTIGGTEVGQGRIEGSIADPVHARGYDLHVVASLAQLADLDRLFVHAGLPRVQGLAISAQLADRGHPELTALRVTAGATRLPRFPDATLQGWSIQAADAAAPLAVAASGSWRGRAVVLKGTVASLQAIDALRSGACDAHRAAPVPVQLAVGVGSSAWRISGVAGARESDVRLQGSVPDLRELLAGAPDIGTVTLGGRLQAQGRTRLLLSDLQVASAAGDLDGSVSLSLQGRPAVTAVLRSGRLDVDRLARWGTGETGGNASPGTAMQPTEGRGAAVPRQAGQAAAQQQGTHQAAAMPQGTHQAAAMKRAGTVLSGDAALPWPRLRAADGDVSLQVGDLVVGGAHYANFRTRAVLSAGRLLVDPFQASGPAGAIDARLQVDAAAGPPTVSLTMRPVMLPAAMLTRLLGAPNVLRGSAELVGQVQAAGESRSALAATASGHVGLSMIDGALANAALLHLVGQSTALSAALPRGGDTALRCLALHATLAGGQAAIDTLDLRTARLSVDGHGHLGLADGALDLHVLPDVSVGMASASIPMRITGSLLDPQTALDAAASGGRYALTIGAGGGPEPDCAAPLRAAREGVAGSVAGAVVPGAVAQPRSGRRKAPKPIDILRGLGFLH